MRARTMPSRLAAAGTLIGVFLLSGGGVAQASGATIAAASTASTQRALNVNGTVQGVAYNLDVYKVSNPSMVVTASGDPTTPTVAQTIHTAPTASCAAGDDPSAGFLNRTITVTVAAGTTAGVYVRIQFDTTDAAGHVVHTTVQPFGPAPGVSVTSPVAAPPTAIPRHLCGS
ncbi:MAG: hypothetical protein NVSMB32_18330 [Actinomycetota bacterium]